MMRNYSDDDDSIDLDDTLVSVRHPRGHMPDLKQMVKDNRALKRATRKEIDARVKRVNLARENEELAIRLYELKNSPIE